MGSVWRRLGTKVTVIDFLDHIVPGTDKDVGKTFLRLLKKQGMKFKLKTAVQSAEVAEEGVALTPWGTPAVRSPARPPAGPPAGPAPAMPPPTFPPQVTEAPGAHAERVLDFS